jgi:hypothetical protein
LQCITSISTLSPTTFTYFTYNVALRPPALRFGRQAATTPTLFLLALDLAVLLKTLREARDDATQTGQQLQKQAYACRDLDSRAARTLTEAVQRATTTLQQEQARTSERIGAETRRQ